MKSFLPNAFFLTFYAIFTFRQRVQHYLFLVIHLAFIPYVVQRHESTGFQLTLCRMNLHYNISPDVKESFWKCSSLYFGVSDESLFFVFFLQTLRASYPLPSLPLQAVAPRNSGNLNSTRLAASLRSAVLQIHAGSFFKRCCSQFASIS